jgi:hypothetical protein
VDDELVRNKCTLRSTAVELGGTEVLGGVSLEARRVGVLTGTVESTAAGESVEGAICVPDLQKNAVVNAITTRAVIAETTTTPGSSKVIDGSFACFMVSQAQTPQT